MRTQLVDQLHALMSTLGLRAAALAQEPFDGLCQGALFPISEQNGKVKYKGKYIHETKHARGGWVVTFSI